MKIFPASMFKKSQTPYFETKCIMFLNDIIFSHKNFHNSSHGGGPT